MPRAILIAAWRAAPVAPLMNSGCPACRRAICNNTCYSITLAIGKVAAPANESPSGFLTTRSRVVISLGAKAPETFKDTLGLGIEQYAGMRHAWLDVPHCRIEL